MGYLTRSPSSALNVQPEFFTSPSSSASSSSLLRDLTVSGGCCVMLDDSELVADMVEAICAGPRWKSNNEFSGVI